MKLLITLCCLCFIKILITNNIFNLLGWIDNSIGNSSSPPKKNYENELLVYDSDTTNHMDCINHCLLYAFRECTE